MYNKAMVVIFLIMSAMLFTVSANANDYECEKCRRRLSECWESQRGMKGIVSGISMASTCTRMENTCNRTCSGNGSNSGPGSGQYYFQNLSPKQIAQETRRIELSLKIQNLLQPYRAQAQQRCIMMGQGIAGIPDNYCVMAMLMPLTDAPNVRKIMGSIGAKRNEEGLVQTLILNSLMQGY